MVTLLEMIYIEIKQEVKKIDNSTNTHGLGIGKSFVFTKQKKPNVVHMDNKPFGILISNLIYYRNYKKLLSGYK